MLKKIIESLGDIIESLGDIKEGEIVTRKWKNGEVVEEKREQVDWKPNAADLDIILVGCECGNQYDIPRDCIMFMNNENSFCGQCGQSGKMEIIADPSPNKGRHNQSLDRDGKKPPQVS